MSSATACCCSEHIRLIAAFDHRHIFIDPEPDAARSYQERRRLFDVPRSSWDEYDRSLISTGGGVWPRTAKAVPISDEIRRALSLETKAESISPTDLIRAILLARVDLLFNGGIGTYVKAGSESQLDVGDKANDAVRVNGAQLRAKVIGEGGNLGLTQRGRVEYALAGGALETEARHAHIYTDFIDNSAGVDCSDHEVNIKVLLGAAMTEGELSLTERDTLLAEMTDEVAALVLRDNYDQANTLAVSRTQARALMSVHRRMIAEMERGGQLDRRLEALPSEEELDARANAGLTSPELAVLLAYTKIIGKRQVLESALPDEEWTIPVLVEYFPTPLRTKFARHMRALRLRREIITTKIVNEVVNRGGVSFLFRAMEETGASADDVIRAYAVVRDIYGLRDLWRAIEELDDVVPTSAQTRVYLEIRRLIDRAVRWLVSNRRSPINVTAEIDRLSLGVAALLPKLGELFHGRERQALLEHAESLTQMGVPADVADRATRVMYSFGLLDIVEVARTTQRDLAEVAGVYYVLSERFRVDELLSKVSALPRDDRWQTLARMALRYDLYAALAALTAEVLTSTDPGRSVEEKVQDWEQANGSNVARTRKAIHDFDESHADLASLSVVLRQIRTLVRASAHRTG